MKRIECTSCPKTILTSGRESHPLFRSERAYAKHIINEHPSAAHIGEQLLQHARAKVAARRRKEAVRHAESRRTKTS